jgi:hypothetical protein
LRHHFTVREEEWEAYAHLLEVIQMLYHIWRPLYGYALDPRGGERETPREETLTESSVPRPKKRKRAETSQPEMRADSPLDDVSATKEAQTSSKKRSKDRPSCRSPKTKSSPSEYWRLILPYLRMISYLE